MTYRTDPAPAAAVEAAREWGARASAYPLDLTRRRGRERAVVDAVVAEHGGLHTLVYAAGPHVPMVHLSQRRPRRRWPAQLAADAAGFFNVVQPALPHLRDAPGLASSR